MLSNPSKIWAETVLKKRKKQDKIKLKSSEAVPLPDRKIEKVVTKQETEQQPSKELNKAIVEKEKRKKNWKKSWNWQSIKGIY